MVDLNLLTSNLSSTCCDFEKRALRLRVDGSELLELQRGRGQRKKSKQEHNGQLLHLDSAKGR